MRLLDHRQFINIFKKKKYAYFSTISFEERATAWAGLLHKNDIAPEKVYLFEYNTHAEPEEDDLRMRRKCREQYINLFGSDIVEFSPSPLNAFAFNGLYQSTLDLVKKCHDMPVLVDVTCMPRVHLIALAAVIVGLRSRGNEWYVTYSTGGSYGFERGVFLGWRDVIIVPIGKVRSFKKEGHARGIILPGHYSDRLSVALQEWEPDCGVILYTNEEGRPDLLCKAREANDLIERRLLKKQLFYDINNEKKAWDIKVMRFDDLGVFNQIIENVANEAAKENGPIVVFPFGPKPFTLQAALSLSKRTECTAMAVYPVPARFDAKYSKGVGHQYPFILDD